MRIEWLKVTTMDASRYFGRGSVKRIADELMGRRVFFSKQYRREHSTKGKVWVEEEGNGVGWVTGVRTLQNGKTVYPRDSWEYESGAAYFAVSGTVRVMCVVTWPTRKAVHVPFTAVQFTDATPVSGLRWPNDSSHDRVRAMMSRDARNSPRDEKGRFV